MELVDVKAYCIFSCLGFICAVVIQLTFCECSKRKTIWIWISARLDVLTQHNTTQHMLYLLYNTCYVMLYNTRYVMLHNTCYVMLYNTCYVMLLLPGISRQQTIFLSDLRFLVPWFDGSMVPWFNQQVLSCRACFSLQSNPPFCFVFMCI